MEQRIRHCGEICLTKLTLCDRQHLVVTNVRLRQDAPGRSLTSGRQSSFSGSIARNASSRSVWKPKFPTRITKIAVATAVVKAFQITVRKLIKTA